VYSTEFLLYSLTFNSSFSSLISIKLGGREKVHHDSLIEICVGVVVGILVLVVVVFICCKMHAGRREHGLVEVDS